MLLLIVLLLLVFGIACTPSFTLLGFAQQSDDYPRQRQHQHHHRDRRERIHRAA